MVTGRRGLLAIVAAIVLTCGPVGCALDPASRAADPGDDATAGLRERLVHPSAHDTVVIAHRSCWNPAPENSLAALRACIALGADGVEFDVRHTSDGIAVVIHDERVDRTTNGHGKVADFTLAQLKALRLKTGNGRTDQALTDETVPTLDEFFTVARGRLLLVFDVKDRTQQTVYAQARSAGVDRQAIFFYECDNDQLLRLIRPFWDQVFVFPIALPGGLPPDRVLAQCPSHPLGMIHAKFDDARRWDDPSVQQALQGKRVWVATMLEADVAGHADAAARLDPEANWGWLLRHGANMVMTNEPAALLRYLDSVGRRRAGVQTHGTADR